MVIDEPELSVHPALQKRLMALFLEYSKTHQIIVCTHSPYFVNWEAIVNGANLIRVVKEGTVSKCYLISDECRHSFGGILRDLNNFLENVISNVTQSTDGTPPSYTALHQ